LLTDLQFGDFGGRLSKITYGSLIMVIIFALVDEKDHGIHISRLIFCDQQWHDCEPSLLYEPVHLG